MKYPKMNKKHILISIVSCAAVMACSQSFANQFVKTINANAPIKVQAKVHIAKNPDTLQNQLAAPSVFIFPPYIQTVGQAVKVVLSVTKVHLSENLPEDISLRLNRPLPLSLRKIGPINVYGALKALTGANVYIITPNTKTIGLSFDRTVSQDDLTHPVIKTSELQKYLNRTNFTLRIAEPLKVAGLKAGSDSKRVISFAKEHVVYFGFNDSHEIVSIAKTQREANALAHDNRAVYYAIAGQTLKQTIERWASSENIKLYWLSHYNMNIEQNGVFFGSFKSSHGALEQLLKAVGMNIKATFSSNGALVIKPNHYSALLLTPGDKS